MSRQSEHVPEESDEANKSNELQKKERERIKEKTIQTVRENMPRYLGAKDDTERRAIKKYVYESLRPLYPSLEYQTIASQFTTEMIRARPQKEPKILVDEVPKTSTPVVTPTPAVTTPSSVQEMAKWQDDLMRSVNASNAALREEFQLQSEEIATKATSAEREKSIDTLKRIQEQYEAKITELESKIPKPKRGRPPNNPQPAQDVEEDDYEPEDEEAEVEAPTGAPAIRYNKGNESHTVMETGNVIPLADAIAKVVATDPYRMVLFGAWKVKHDYKKDFAHFVLDCLAGDQRVLTLLDGSYAWVPIRTLKAGQFVLSYDFQNNGYCFQPITQHWYSGKKEIFRVKLANGREFLATGNHKLFVHHRAGERTDIRQLTVSEISTAMANLKTRAARSNYALVSPLKIPSLGSDFDRDKLWLQGAFIAEGWQSHKGKQGQTVGGGSIAVKDKGFFDEINRRIANVYGKRNHPVPSVIQKRGIYQTYIRKSTLIDDYGHMAMRKHFMPFHLRLSEDALRDLLTGYIRGDGHVDINEGKPRLTYKMTSMSLADQLSIMYLVLGEPLHLAINPASEGGNVAGRPITGRNQQYILNQKDHWFSRPIAEGISRTTIRYIEPAGVEDTYEINVATTHSYVLEAGIISHNCVDEFFLLRNVDLAYTERIKKGGRSAPEITLEEGARRQLLRDQFSDDSE